METKRGGSRPNSGRKKSTDKKLTIVFYIPESIVNSYGSKEAFKEHYQDSFIKKDNS